MRDEELRFDAQKRGWSTLRSLRAQPIDLCRVALVREHDRAPLSDISAVEALLLRLGLNDEGLRELPPALHAHCGGLRIWQYPTQLSKYLVQLSRLGVRSYLEIGVRHGGSFVATVEYLDRFATLDFAVGVDVIDCPSMADYGALHPRVQFWQTSSRSADFARRLDALGAVDLVFIDSHHEEAQCREELALLLPRASMLALHDIANIGCPDIGRVWSDLKHAGDFACFEFVDQYPGLGPFMGIGLAVRRDRLRAAAPPFEET